MSILRTLSAIVLVSILFNACDVKVTTNAPGTLPQSVQDAWVDVFQEREITAYDITANDDDTTYTLYSGFKNEDAAALEFYVKNEGDEDHDSYQMTVSESGDVLNIREETVLTESEFPEDLLAIIREKYPDRKLAGMRRILEDEAPSFGVTVVLRDTDDLIEVEKFRFSLDGEILERSHINREKERTIGITVSN